MAEIRRNIRVEEIPAALRQVGSPNSPTTREDVAYMTDLSWRNKWQETGRIVPIGGATGIIFDAAITRSGLVVSRGEIEGKLQPSYVESLLETEKRLEFLHNYLPNLPETVLGVVSGGSMSYGRFNNVRAGYPDSSDLDLLFIIDHPPRDTDVDQIVRTDLGFSKSELSTFRDRLPVFEEGFREGKMDVLSQKFTLLNKGFDVSAHFIPKSVIGKFMDRDLKADIQNGGDIDARLKDYKPAPFKHRVNNQRDFFGNAYPLAIDEFSTTNGVISMIPAYAIFSENLVPGMYHNLCSPMFEVALDRGGVTDVMDTFQTVMYESLEKARLKRADAAVSNSHIRQLYFSQHIRNEIDRI